MTSKPSGQDAGLRETPTWEAASASTGHRVPTNSGGVQIEWHQNGWDIEIEFDATGRIIGASIGVDHEQA